MNAKHIFPAIALFVLMGCAQAEPDRSNPSPYALPDPCHGEEMGCGYRCETEGEEFSKFCNAQGQCTSTWPDCSPPPDPDCVGQAARLVAVTTDDINHPVAPWDSGSKVPSLVMHGPDVPRPYGTGNLAANEIVIFGNASGNEDGDDPRISMEIYIDGHSRMLHTTIPRGEIATEISTYIGNAFENESRQFITTAQDIEHEGHGRVWADVVIVQIHQPGLCQEVDLEDPELRKKHQQSGTISYQDTINGELFAEIGPSEHDVQQGAVGDCYFMAALASVAGQNPDYIRDMIRDNHNGTYSVRFYYDELYFWEVGGGTDNFKADWVTVDDDLPRYQSEPEFDDYFRQLRYDLRRNEEGTNIEPYAWARDTDGDGREEIWAAIIEKAFVVYVQERRPRGINYESPGYEGIHGANPQFLAYETIVGERSRVWPLESEQLEGEELQAVLSSVRKGQYVNVATSMSDSADLDPFVVDGIFAMHVHSVLEVMMDDDGEVDSLLLYNPWGLIEPGWTEEDPGDGVFILASEDLWADFDCISYTLPNPCKGEEMDCGYRCETEGEGFSKFCNAEGQCTSTWPDCSPPPDPDCVGQAAQLIAVTSDDVNQPVTPWDSGSRVPSLVMHGLDVPRPYGIGNLTANDIVIFGNASGNEDGGDSRISMDIYIDGHFKTIHATIPKGEIAPEISTYVENALANESHQIITTSQDIRYKYQDRWRNVVVVQMHQPGLCQPDQVTSE